jgi:DNA-binding CsgD family transcriptional regulator/PAS domain-containing protein
MVEPGLSERAAVLVERLLTAPADPATWRAFLAELCDEVGDDFVALLIGEILPGGPTMILGHGVELDAVAPYEVQPMGAHPPAEALPVGKAAPIPVESAAFAGSNLFRTVLSERGVPPGPGLMLPLSRTPHQVTAALFLLSRDPAWRPQPRDFALLDLLAPYVTIAAGAGIRLNEEQTKTSALIHALRRLRLGVILLDVRNRVSFANDSALGMLGLDDVAAPDEELRRRATRTLSAMLRRPSPGASLTLQYPHPDDGRPISLLVAPLRWGEDDDAERRQFTTALFVSDPHGPTGTSSAMLRQLYGLSAGEARLAWQLATGHDLAAAAENLGIQLSTARGVLRSVFRKTGTHRQSSLVRLILSGPGQVRVDPAGKGEPSPRRKQQEG